MEIKKTSIFLEKRRSFDWGCVREDVRKRGLRDIGVERDVGVGASPVHQKAIR
jgi:hypothetical protein